MRLMKAVILAHGQPPTDAFVRSVVQSADLFLAADGAATFAQAIGIVPHIVSGDFDSVSVERAREMFPDAEIVPTPDQDFADTEKAIQLVRERGATESVLIGANGGRMDFTFANIALLLRFAPEIPLVCLHDDGAGRITEMRAVTAGACRFAAHPGETLSLLALESGVVVSVVGVGWTLDNAPLPIGTHGISNVVSSHEVTVTAHSGTVLVFRQWTQKH
jgi:thiamine pyrophosphokinase